MYLPILGRFLQVDPVEGGTDNNYAYANDPVNEFDLDGRWIRKAWDNTKKAVKNAAKWAWKHKTDIALTAAAFVPGAGSVAVAARVASVAYRVRKVTAATKSGVYVARTTSGKLYVGQTNNFARRAYQHARAGKIKRSSPRIQIPIKSKIHRNRVESFIYYLLGTKRAPWLANKIRPPRARIR